jgi:hypothetical protein
LLTGGLTLGLETWGCLVRSNRGTCFRRRKRTAGMGSRGSIARSLHKGQRKVGVGVYLHIEPFILALDSFYGLTSNFSSPITCFEAISLFISKLRLHPCLPALDSSPQDTRNLKVFWLQTLSSDNTLSYNAVFQMPFGFSYSTWFQLTDLAYMFTTTFETSTYFNPIYMVDFHDRRNHAVA